MTSAEWKREAVEHLIEVYKKHPVLYNMRHPRYYNKSTRSEALNALLAEIHDVRPETTVQEVLRKIQTLRTQFGQEISKVRRGSRIGIPYKPSAWWYKGLSFLQNHIKHRSASPVKGDPLDSSWKQEPEEYKVSIIQSASVDTDVSQHEYDYSLDGTEYETEVHYEIDPIDTRNMKTVEVKAVPMTQQYSAQSNGNENKRQRLSTGVYQDAPQQCTPSSGSVFELAATPKYQPLTINDVSTMNDRNRSLGHFVASQVTHIRDDGLFFETQMEVLNVLNRGILRQLNRDKGEPDGISSRAN